LVVSDSLVVLVDFLERHISKITYYVSTALLTLSTLWADISIRFYISTSRSTYVSVKPHSYNLAAEPGEIGP